MTVPSSSSTPSEVGDAAETGPDGRPTAGTSAADATTSGSVLRGGAWNSLALLLPQFFVLAASAAAARALGADLMGRQSLISFVGITVVGLASVGLPLSLMRTVANALGEGRADEVRGLLPWAWRLLGLTGAVGGAVVASGAVITSYERAAWLLAGYVTLVSVLQAVPGAVLVGMQRWRSAATAGLVTGALSTVAGVWVLGAGGGVTGMFVVESVVVTVNLFWTGLLARRALEQVAPTGRPSPELRRSALRFARPASALALLEVVVWKRSEFFFLARYSTPSEIAQYSIAFAAVLALTQLPNALVSVTSSFATLHGAGAVERIRAGFTRGVRLLLAVVAPLTLGTVALGPPAVELVYGDTYRPAAQLVLVLLIAFPLLPLGGLCDALLTGRGELTWQLRAVAAAVPVNLGLCLLLVPDHGALGAALANVAGQVVATVPVLVHTWRALDGRLRDLRLPSLARAVAVAAGAAAAAALVERSLPGPAALALLAGVVGFAVTWAVLARWLSVLSGEDGAWLAEALGRRVAVLGRAVVAVSR